MENIMRVSFVKEYVTSTSAVFTTEIQRSLQESLWMLYQSIALFLRSILHLVSILLLVASKLITMGFPHFIAYSKIIIDFHRNQLTIKEVLMELTIVGSIVLYLLFRKKIATIWCKFESDLSQKSKRLARIAPHMLFFTVSGITAIVGQKLLAPLSTPLLLPIFLLAIPIFTTLRCLNSSCSNQEVKFTKLLQLWSIISTFLSIAMLSSFIPFGSFINSRLIFVREFVVVVLIWLQLSSSSVVLVYESVQPILNTLLSRIPTINMDPNKQGYFFKMLSFVGIVNSRQESFLRTLFQDGIALIIAVSMIFTPFSSLSVILVGLLLPVYNSSDCISRYSIERARKWLRYWVCLGCIWMVKYYLWPGIWTSVQVPIFLWLQHTYFCGADVVFDFISDARQDLMVRHRRIQSSPLIEPDKNEYLSKTLVVRTETIDAEVVEALGTDEPTKPNTSSKVLSSAVNCGVDLNVEVVEARSEVGRIESNTNSKELLTSIESNIVSSTVSTTAVEASGKPIRRAARKTPSKQKSGDK